MECGLVRSAGHWGPGVGTRRSCGKWTLRSRGFHLGVSVFSANWFICCGMMQGAAAPNAACYDVRAKD